MALFCHVIKQSTAFSKITCNSVKLQGHVNNIFRFLGLFILLMFIKSA